MSTSYLSVSIAMMRSILDGKSYEAVGKEVGLTRSAVEQRVKGLARDLQLIVGVIGVNDDVNPTVEVLRSNKEAFLEALDHYRPEHDKGGRDRHALVNGNDIDRLVAKTWQKSACANRDVALLLTLFSTAAKPLEIARLEVRDYLNPDGTVREESVMRAEAAINGAERPLFFASGKANDAIDAYLLERAQLGYGVKRSRKYRGFDPMSRLFLTDDGKAMPIKVRQAGNRRQHLCVAILAIYRKIFARVGLPGMSALSARRMIAHKLKQRGAGESEIGKMLGLKEKESVRNLLPERHLPLVAMARELV